MTLEDGVVLAKEGVLAVIALDASGSAGGTGGRTSGGILEGTVNLTSEVASTSRAQRALTSTVVRRALVVSGSVGSVLVVARSDGVATADGDLTSEASSVGATVVAGALGAVTRALRTITSVARAVETTARTSVRRAVES